ncbi:hypothetical protein VM1G_08987 [Cytospora mali]|uniref:2EXR domain-containing protein n=1 Tax=Cytospora mali TaxID=578113 RepID=A0A194W9Z3_CYTMA|nr:hypothetical protein VM1G_08987 [Valsa mali]
MPQPVSDLALKVDKLRLTTAPPSSILATKDGDMTPEDQNSRIVHPSTIIGKMLRRRRNAHLFDSPCSETVNFSMLPTEIRLKIYEMTWETRRVRISRKRIAQQRVGRQWMKDLKRGTANAPPNEELVTTSCTRPPATLWINYESRSETLKHYQLSFTCPSEGTSHVYFNFDIDELQISRHCRVRPAISREELARLRVLVVPSRSVITEALWDKQDQLNALEALWPAADDTIMDVVSALDDIMVSNAVDIRAEDIKSFDEMKRLQSDMLVANRVETLVSSVCPSLERLEFQLVTTCDDWSSSRSIVHHYYRVPGYQGSEHTQPPAEIACKSCLDSYASFCLTNYPPPAGSRRRIYGESIERDFYLDHTNPWAETVLKTCELRAGQTTIVYHSFDRAEAVASSLTGIHSMVQDIAAVWQGVMGDVAHVFGRKVSLLELQDIFHHTW